MSQSNFSPRKLPQTGLTVSGHTTSIAAVSAMTSLNIFPELNQRS